MFFLNSRLSPNLKDMQNLRLYVFSMRIKEVKSEMLLSKQVPNSCKESRNILLNMRIACSCFSRAKSPTSKPHLTLSQS